MGKKFLFAFLTVTFSFVLFAAVEDSVTTQQWLLETFGALATIPGASGIAIAAVAVQVVMRFFQTPLAAFTGKARLVIVAGLSIVGVCIAGVVAGGSVTGVLLSGVGLAAVEVFLHQIYVQFFTKAD